MAHVDRNRPVRAKSSDSQYSLMEFMQDFPDDATCLDWLWRTRYAEDGEHADCAKCGRQRTFKRYATSQRRQSWTCTSCGSHIHPTAGTVFHKSSTSLHLWFYAMYLMTSTRCGISAKQLEREIGVTYKTAWRMMKLIRQELMYDDDEEMPRIHKRVLGRATIFTDEWGGYTHLERAGWTHRRIKHAAGVFVVGDVHTQTIENFWSLVKRGIGGVYHSVSAKHLHGYLNEYVWRYNHRDQPRAMFLTLILRAAKP